MKVADVIPVVEVGKTPGHDMVELSIELNPVVGLGGLVEDVDHPPEECLV